MKKYYEHVSNILTGQTGLYLSSDQQEALLNVFADGLRYQQLKGGAYDLGENELSCNMDDRRFLIESKIEGPTLDIGIDRLIGFYPREYNGTQLEDILDYIGLK